MRSPKDLKDTGKYCNGLNANGPNLGGRRKTRDKEICSRNPVYTCGLMF
jgi:hypothetical protein